MVEEVREASLQQTQGIDQVSQTLAQMEKVTQTTAATAEESAAASEELNAQAEGTIAVVHQLQALVGVSRKGSAPVSHAPAEPAAPVVTMQKRTAAPVPVAEPVDETESYEETGTFGKF